MSTASNEVRASEITFNEAILRVAAAHERTVEFRYAKGKDAKVIETRQLKPSGVAVGRDGHVTFTGYDPDREEPRAFRLDRIKGDYAGPARRVTLQGELKIRKSCKPATS